MTLSPTASASATTSAAILRAHAEQQFASELEALVKSDTRPRPPSWRLSPWAVALYLLGGKTDDGAEITPKYTFGHGQYPDLGTHPLGGWVDWDLPLWNTFSPSGRNDYVGHDTPNLKELMVKHRQELDPKKRLSIAHEWQREVAKEMVIIPFPGNATSFSLGWPWLGNWGWHQVAGGGTAQQEVLVNWFYDKSKDTRTT